MNRIFMKGTLTFGIILLLALSSPAQPQLGVKLATGFSLAQNIDKGNNFGTWINCLTYPSGQIGMTVMWKTGNKSSIGTELLIDQLSTKNKVKLGTSASHYPEYDMSFTCLSLPVYYNLGINSRVTANLGVQFNKSICSRQENNLIALFKFNDPTDPLLLDKQGWTKTSKWFDSMYGVGIRAGMFYQLSDRFDLEINLYHDIVSNIENRDQTLGNKKWTVGQVNVGVRYSLKRKLT